MYIGCTRDVVTRFKTHFSELRTNRKIKVSNVNKKKSGEVWQKDFEKYGEENFECYVLEEVSYEARYERETYYIRLYDTTNPMYGYNSTVSKGRDVTVIHGLPPSMNGVTVDELIREENNNDNNDREENKTNE